MEKIKIKQRDIDNIFGGFIAGASIVLLIFAFLII